MKITKADDEDKHYARAILFGVAIGFFFGYIIFGF